MRIGEVARRAGVSVDAVRLYERRGILAPAARTFAGYREFAADTPTRVADIKLLQAAGLSLDEIATLFAASAPERHACADVAASLESTVARLEEQIALLSATRDLAASTHSACVEGHCGADSGCRAAAC